MTAPPLVIAHRGASAAHPANTVAAFAAAGPLGADGVELDVRRTADGAAVVVHDETLPDGRALVETARADLPGWVPTLAEALDACGDLLVNVEVKNWPGDGDFDPEEAMADAVVAELLARGGGDRYLVSCFHRPTVDRVRERAPGLATAYLHVHVDGPTALAEAVAHGHGALHPWSGLVTADLVAAAHDAGVVVNTWTVDDPDEMVRLAALGVDGIVTNVPDVARSVVGPR
ncbi:glycerophosphodiester phosphodiesterase [Iamia majanohamensis]|uniref:Glycerophosphodiester phosphodiesterase n=1 Tax=Iamia majanohamensis TaxID=467976 RepID=A0AAE9Y6Q6_9ACTN|nr:glycerophosphodiester phosphodiesterase [Iamia majanohamensis]WCO67714.1 glycerophosphodiester phosphodiesterase [Iamia majanohamensis]